MQVGMICAVAVMIPKTLNFIYTAVGVFLFVLVGATITMPFLKIWVRDQLD